MLGTGCCALVRLFKRSVCLTGTAAVVGHAGGGGGDPRERLWLFMSPGNPCAHPTVARRVVCKTAPHGTPHGLHTEATQFCCEPQPHLPGLVCPGPHEVDVGVHTWPLPSPEDRKPGVGCNLKPTTDTTSSSTLQKLDAVGATTFTVRVIKLSLQCPRLLQHRACGLPGPEGVHCEALLLPPGTTSHGLLGH